MRSRIVFGTLPSLQSSVALPAALRPFWWSQAVVRSARACALAFLGLLQAPTGAARPAARARSSRAASRRRGRAEEPGRGLRAHGRGGDVEGAPVVASRIGGIQDQIVDGETGMLLDDPLDLAAYGAAVRSLLDDPARAEALGREAKERAPPVPRHARPHQSIELYERHIQGRRRRGQGPKRVVPRGVVRSPTSPPAAGASLHHRAAARPAWTSCTRWWRSASVSSTPRARRLDDRHERWPRTGSA